ncbi:MAG: nickel-responsive transcriptional regulator NikR [Acidobacteria bacterium]|jgi:CopG family nickel-responsive transcriptional regulator|nr:MAG: nickel-responsive transcriptional regulator NikR [Acidobacteriota bacterium]
MEDRSVRFCVSLPESLLQELDHRVIKRGYASRSELVRDLIRELLVRERWEEGGDVVGVLSIVYDHHDKELTFRLLDLQHQHHVNVLCSTHVHLDHHNCLEVIILRGDARELSSLAVKLGGLRGVKLYELTKVSSL